MALAAAAVEIIRDSRGAFEEKGSKNCDEGWARDEVVKNKIKKITLMNYSRKVG